MADRISLAVPYTVPMDSGNWTQYTKGSAHWLKTLVQFMAKTGDFDIFLMGPAYEGLFPEHIDRPWRNLPIIHAPPYQFEALKNIPPDQAIDVRAPINGYTLDPKNALTSSVGPREFRAETEVTRWYLDMMPALFGLPHFDVVFPQHMSWNLIASAHYAALGKLIGISHETCARCNKDNGEGGWAAVDLRRHVLNAFDVNEGVSKAIAISKMVEHMLTNSPDGPRLPADRIVTRTNPYNEKIYFPIDDMTKQRFVDEHLNAEFKAQYRKDFGVDFVDVPTDGKWLVFVGRDAEFKGVEQLLRSWATCLKEKYPDGGSKDVLFLIGPDTGKPEFQEYAKRLGVFDNVRFFEGRKPDEFINPLYNAADLAVMTSLHEGDGVVAKQPGGTGLRVVATDSGGPSEYMNELMGIRAASRDPSLKTSKQRGFELLVGRRIVWGDIELFDADILRHYAEWRQFYGAGIKDKAVAKRRKAQIDRLIHIADNWNDFRPLRHYVARVLYSEIKESSVPSFQPPDKFKADPRQFYKDLDLLAEAYRVMGGMDVETGSLAQAYAKEFSETPEIRRALGKLAYRNATKTFSSAEYVKWLTPMLEEAAARPFDPSAVPVAPVQDTVVAGMKALDEVSKAFRAWQNANTPARLVGAVTAFNRAVVAYLGNPENYADRWPTPAEAALRDPLRSSKIAAQLAGVSFDVYEAQRDNLVANTQANPELQSALYMAHVGGANPAVLPAAAAMSTSAMLSTSSLIR